MFAEKAAAEVMQWLLAVAAAEPDLGSKRLAASSKPMVAASAGEKTNVLSAISGCMNLTTLLIKNVLYKVSASLRLRSLT